MLLNSILMQHALLGTCAVVHLRQFGRCVLIEILTNNQVGIVAQTDLTPCNLFF